MFLGNYARRAPGLKFWKGQITTDEANGKEYFGEFDDRSSVVSLYSQVMVRNILRNCTASFAKFIKTFVLQYFPTYSIL